MTELERQLLSSVERLEKESRERETLLLKALSDSEKRIEALTSQLNTLTKQQKELLGHYNTVMETYNEVLKSLESFNER